MILMLNCSYKSHDSNTQFFLELLKAELAVEEIQILPLRQVLNGGFPEFVKKLEEAEAFVIGAPLYVDGLPAQAVKLLEMLLDCDKSALYGKRVYVVSNLGFYEGEQICNLLEIVRNWCARMEMTYGGGLAVGAGGFRTPLSAIFSASVELAVKAIRSGLSAPNISARAARVS